MQSLARVAPVAVSIFAFSAILPVAVPSQAGAPSDAKVTADESPVSLADAVKEFNNRAGRDAVGSAEPVLTEDEVIAALRGIIRSQHPQMTDDIYDALQKVVTTGMMPAKASLTFTTGWGYKGHKFRVWWVDLSIMTGENTGYTYRLRDRKISSRPLTDAEGKAIAQQAGKSLEGRWNVERMERGGRSPQPGLLKGVMVAIEGDTVTIEDGGRMESGEFKLDPAKEPAEIEIVFKEGANADVERIALGVYELKGDSLKLAWRKDGGERPTEFSSIPGERTSELWILKRAKPLP